MLVSAARRSQGPAGAALTRGDTLILTVRADGAIDDQPLATLRGAAVQALAGAPATFGPYGGGLFVSGRGGPGGEGKKSETPGASPPQKKTQRYQFHPRRHGRPAAARVFTRVPL